MEIDRTAYRIVPFAPGPIKSNLPPGRPALGFSIFPLEGCNTIPWIFADRQLNEVTDKKLVEEFERVEEERMGHGKHEEFHRFMEELQKSYGS